MLKELKKSSPSEMGPYLCSKWIYHYFLIDADELKDLLEQLKTSYIFPIGKILTNYKLDPISEFVLSYKVVIDQLRKRIVDVDELKKKLPLAISKSLDTFYLYSPKPNTYTVKIVKPVLQLQLASFRYSSIDQTVRLNSLGDDSVFWGFKLSYPQIFQDPKSNEIAKIDRSFVNFSYYSLIRKWLRDKTDPIKFIIDQKKIMPPIRVGKKCLPWVHLHPQLKEIGCRIDNYAN